MHLTGDYASLVDWNGDYLDKPHLLFWLSAFSFKLFGVTSFAYKLPSFLLTIGGIYSTYRFAAHLYNKEIGRLAALMLASAFAFIVSLSDVRMEAILTAAIAFSCWRLTVFIDQKKIKNVILAGLGLAVAFATKGQIGVFVPAVFSFFYILYKKDYPLFLNWKWLLLVVVFGICISPVLYAYYLQYNLHPEKMIRGKDHINGIKFILFNQSVERFSGGMGHDAKNDYLFFIHSFLWAFAPWSILVFMAIFKRLKKLYDRNEEWGTTGCFIAVMLIVSFSGFKLPHYLNIIFPVSAVIAAHFILNIKSPALVRWVYAIQLIISFVLLLLTAFINGWAFPVKNIFIIAAVVFLLALFFYLLRKKELSPTQKSIAVPASAILVFFFLMNTNFYPRLLKYQAGQQLFELTKGRVDPADVYIEKGEASYSSSYNFYSKSLFKPFDDSLLNTGKRNWILTEPNAIDRLKKAGYQFGTIYTTSHFRVTKLNLKFMNPATRESELSSMMIAELVGKK